jgi:O-antigen/teichoic acid export membrane protein
MSKYTELLTDETLSQKLIKKWFWLYFFWYLWAPLWYFIRLIISNSPDVSVADFWVMYSIISLVTFLWTYNDLWLTESLRFFLPRFYIKKEYNNIKTIVWISLWVQLFTSIIIASCLRLWNEWLSVHYFKNEHAWIILKYFCLYFTLTNILQVIQSIFISFQKTFEQQLTYFIQISSTLAFALFCFFSGNWNIEWYSIWRILWMFIWIIMGWLLYRKYHPRIMKWKFKRDTNVLNKYVKYALWAFIGSGIGTLFWQIIQQMVLYFLWAENAWHYSNFLSLFQISSIVIGPIMWLIFPIVSEFIEKNDNFKLSLLYSFFYNYFSILILSLSTLFIALWPEISITLFWKQYITSWELLAQSWIFLFFSMLAWFNYSVLAWMGKVKERVYITWIACILTIITAFALIKLYGIYGAWLAFGLSNAYTRWFSLFLIKKEKYSLNFDWKFIIKNILLFIVLWLGIILWKGYIIDVDWNRWYMIVRLIIIGLVFYWIIFIWNLEKVKFLKLEIIKLRK